MVNTFAQIMNSTRMNRPHNSGKLFILIVHQHPAGIIIPLDQANSSDLARFAAGHSVVSVLALKDVNNLL